MAGWWTSTWRSFFDRVNHDKLMAQIAKRVEDKRLLKLIRAFLNGVMENGLISPSVEGTPQGGPLSPLLSNLVLDALDRELVRRGHRHVSLRPDPQLRLPRQPQPRHTVAPVPATARRLTGKHSYAGIAVHRSDPLTLELPLCGGTMRVVERLSAAQLLLRAPPQPDRCAA